MVRSLIRRIVDSVAKGQQYHLKLVFSDNSPYHSTHFDDPDVTIMFRNRAAEWRMALGGMFEFLESYFNGDIDVVGEQGLRPGGIELISATFNIKRRPTNYCTFFPAASFPAWLRHCCSWKNMAWM